jgi:hypothetical protein
MRVPKNKPLSNAVGSETEGLNPSVGQRRVTRAKLIAQKRNHAHKGSAPRRSRHELIDRNIGATIRGAAGSSTELTNGTLDIEHTFVKM